jgi:Heparinase II/III-like protein/Heparinase II/III N-terminus
MSSLAWKINRLRLMGVPELAWRVQQVAQKKAAKFGLGLVQQVPAPDLSRPGRSWLPAEPPAGLDRDAVCAAADRILAGRWNVFALRELPLGFPPDWNRCPKTGTLAPRTLGKTIEYRSETVVGDIKYLWEPSRHLETVALAQAWAVTQDRRYLDGLRTLLESWFDQCPYPMGVHWTSSLELGVRLLNWAFAWHLVGGAQSALFEGEDGQRFLRRWLDAIYQHAHFISGYFSKHSSANNHLLGEYMGLFVAAVNWPCWPESARWRELAQAGFEREALKQNTTDGVNKEQAVYYQHEVMDMMLLCHVIAQANGLKFSPAVLERLERLAEFIAAVMDTQGHVPMIGDADDAQMVRLSHGEAESPYRSLLASCALLFKRGDFKAKAGTLDDKTRWLFGAEGIPAWEALPPGGHAPARMAFPEGGYSLLGAHWGTPHEIRLLADAAPLGYLSIAAHGHADALAFTLSLGGEEFLIDPGTYAYHTQKLWRDYFRGTYAHNTVRIDEVDQSEIGGNFMWMRKAQARLLRHEPQGQVQTWSASHDGYRRLRDPVTHTRELLLDADARTLTVVDTLQCQALHTVELCWHWAEHVDVTLSTDGVVASGYRSRITLATDEATGVWTHHRGETPRVSGWVSRRFDEKTPSATTAYRLKIKGDTKITTILNF